MKNKTQHKLTVCVIAICYNAEDDALALLFSIVRAYEKVECMDLHVVLCDNSAEVSTRLEKLSMPCNYHYIKSDNIGYFPGFVKGLDFAKGVLGGDKHFDYSMVTNVDLRISDNFFSVLRELDIEKNVGVIAPRIQSQNSGCDINPKILTRPNAKRLKMLKFIFSYQLLYKLHKKLSEYRSKRRQQDLSKSYVREIYAAHGSFIIFTKAYFKSGATVNYPRFLFGEEVFVAEEARLHQLKVVHDPNFIIYDKEHGSTGSQASVFIASEHVKSYEYLINKYFK